MQHNTILVAIGSNLPGPGGETPLETCRWAVERLADLPGLRLVACSRWYGTSPVPPSGQPDYVNGVVRVSGGTEPHGLLGALHEIEAQAQRVRAEINAARTLDLDLLAVDSIMIHDPVLTLPHPRLHQRAFVLAPLADVAPEWRHPMLHRSVAELLAGVSQDGIAVLP
jgi:2-amino-4-hydroxy-6-hydroxymethyldihydropteridine diphosphokinase